MTHKLLILTYDDQVLLSATALLDGEPQDETMGMDAIGLASWLVWNQPDEIRIVDEHGEHTQQ